MENYRIFILLVVILSLFNEAIGRDQLRWHWDYGKSAQLIDDVYKIYEYSNSYENEKNLVDLIFQYSKGCDKSEKEDITFGRSISVPFEVHLEHFSTNETCSPLENYLVESVMTSDGPVDIFKYNARMSLDFLLNLTNSSRVHVFKVGNFKDELQTSSIKTFDNCILLTSLAFTIWEVREVSATEPQWWSQLPEPTGFIIQKIPLCTITVMTSGDLTTDFIATHCNLIDLPSDISTKHLSHLDLSHNKLKSVTLGYKDFYGTVSNKWKNLTEFSVAHNPHYNFCEEMRMSRYTSKLPGLRIFSIAATNSTEFCFKESWLHRLEYLNITYNNIQEVEVADLIFSEKYLEVDLKGNPITVIKFSNNDYDQLARKTWLKSIISLLIDTPLDCDCKNAWLAQALRENLLSIPNATCFDGTALLEVPLALLKCDKATDDECIYRYMWSTQAVIGTCSNGGLRSIPRGKNVTELYAANNNVESIAADDLPERLKILDLRNNNLSHIEESVAEVLFNTTRIIYLSGNPLLCDCYNKGFLQHLKANQHYVIDFNKTVCADTNLPISSVTPDGISCYSLSDDTSGSSPLITIVLSLCIVIVITIILITLIYWVYEENIKIFLSFHGWDLFCLHRGDNNSDLDCQYDILISFNIQDEKFVNEKLIPPLNSDYKICKHQDHERTDGEWIPSQIEELIHLSKRTVIVLSRMYLDSLWRMNELLTAQTSTVKGRSRVIVVVIDDVAETHVKEEKIRQFLSTNTCLKWSDPRFWQKLKYALHIPHENRETEPVYEESSPNNAIEMVSGILTLESNYNNAVDDDKMLQNLQNA